jgi:hypothetical protein
LLLLEQGVHQFVVYLLLKISEDDHTFDSLFDAGIAFGFLGMLIHCIVVKLSGQTLFLMRRDVIAFSMPLMIPPYVSWFCM